MPACRVAQQLRDQIVRAGPITFAQFQAAALDDFFGRGHGAGRSGGDFVTSPEVGSLFGALVAGGLDRVWRGLGQPDPFVVVDAGGGRGRLLADVLRAEPACTTALRVVLVERSATLRTEARSLLTLEPADVALGPFEPGDPESSTEPVPGSGPVATTLDDLPAAAFTGVIIANELLDNLPVRIAERRHDGWLEVRVGLSRGTDGFEEVLVPAAAALARRADELVDGAAIPEGGRLPIATAVDDWLVRCAGALRHGEVWVIDYGDPVVELVARGPTGPSGWLRTYRGHGRGADPLDAPGEQDVTADLVVEALRRAAHHAGLRVRAELTQADWLRRLGLDRLVEAGQRTWTERAHVGDLPALAARSRTVEGAALTDPAGLGGHRVTILTRP